MTVSSPTNAQALIWPTAGRQSGPSAIRHLHPTTQGGSGGPVFNKNGQVIAVEYAVLPRFGGNSFGVPIAYAVELLTVPRRRPGD